MRVLFVPLLLAVLGCEAPAIGEPERPAADDRSETTPAKSAEPAAASGRKTNAAADTLNVADLRTRKMGIDWPDFLGPNRDSKSPETGILTDWSGNKLRKVWTRALAGPRHADEGGYDIGVTYLGRFLQFDRDGDVVRLTCLNSETGEEIWKFEYPIEYQDLLGYNNGPRCCPVVDGDRVYILGAEGMLHCLRVADGSPVWKLNTNEKYGVVQNFFGVGSTPIVEGDLLIAMIGGSPPNSPETYSGMVQGNGSGIVAFDKYTGEEKYRLTDELASYASPIAATIHDRRWCFVFARGGLMGFQPASGKLDFHFPWRSQILESVNAATPIVLDDRVFVTETYGPGSAMLRVKPGGYEVVWQDRERTRDKSLQCHWNTPIHLDGYLYGSSGRHTANAELRCIRAEDGQVMWSEPNLTRCSLLYVDGHFVCLGEYGTLRLVRATPDQYDEVARIDLEEDGPLGGPLLRYPAWAAPVLSHGLLYVRGETNLACLELIPND